MQTQNNFDGLRLLAAWLVLFSHSWPLFGIPEEKGEPLARWVGIDTFGGVAVIMFFAISGYLCTQSLERCASVIDFAWRRAVRIMPALIALISVSVFLIGPVVTAIPLDDYFSHSKTWQYLQNIYFRTRFLLPGVFEDLPAQGGINGSLWSLLIEIKMYVLLALVGLLPARFRLPVIGCLVVAAGLIALWHHFRAPIQSRLFLMTHSLHVSKLTLAFFVGSVFALTGLLRRLKVWHAALVLGILLIGFAAIDDKRIQRICMVAFPVAVTWLTLQVGVARWRLLSQGGRWGDVSYGVFLWAYPIQQCVMYFFMPRSLTMFVLLSSLGTFFVALLSWRWIEAPALQHKALMSDNVSLNAARRAR